MDVVIVGSGVVGTATGRGFRAKGHRVLFCDAARPRVELLRDAGFEAIHTEALGAVRADAYLLSVPTPTVDGAADLACVREAAEALGSALAGHPGRPLVVVRSTVPPGTTEELVVPVVQFVSGLRAGKDFSVCMNPEFLRAATAEDDFLHPRVIVIGVPDKASERATRRLYAPWNDVPVLSMSVRSAEATKYVANVFNATKISFFNELHQVLIAAGADPEAAFRAVAIGAEGMWNPTYGTRGGSPYGGVCLPKDTVAFRRYAEDLGAGDLVTMLRATIAVNERLEAESVSGERTDDAAAAFREAVG